MVSSVSFFVVDGGALEAVEASTVKLADESPSHVTTNRDATKAIVLVDDVDVDVDVRVLTHGFERLGRILVRFCILRGNGWKPRGL